MPRWFDAILHIGTSANGKFVAVQPCIVQGYRYTAKDRHGTLVRLSGKNVLKLELDEEGYPGDEIANAIV